MTKNPTKRPSDAQVERLHRSWLKLVMKLRAEMLRRGVRSVRIRRVGPQKFEYRVAAEKGHDLRDGGAWM